MADKDSLVHVEIFGQDYAVRGGEDPGYVERLASYVDEQMKEVSRAGGAVDSLRIAVLAALNIADERFQLKDEVKEANARARVAGSGTEERLAKLAHQLDVALGK
jgi:cell division protein ZapA